MVVVNKMCSITLGNHIKDTMIELVLHLTGVSLNMAVASAVKERQVLWTTYDNLHTWFMSFRESFLQYRFTMFDSD